MTSFRRGRRKWRRRRRGRSIRRSGRRFGRKRYSRRRRSFRGARLGKGIVRFKCVEPDTAAAFIQISNALDVNSYVQHRISEFTSTNLPVIRALYQQARCVKCTYHFRPRVKCLNIQSVPNLAANVGNTPPPDLYAYIDYETDAGGISTAACVSAGCRRLSVYKGGSFTFVPKTLMMNEETLGTTAYIPKAKQWFDSADVPVYRGVRFFSPFWLSMPANIQPMGWEVTRTTWWEFRRLKAYGGT